MNILDKVKTKIRDVKDFPKPGIVFKDVTPLLADPIMCAEIVDHLANDWRSENLDAIVGIESRGFLFGMLLAQSLSIPFVPIRKEGKLPWDTIAHTYSLEYGKATVEIHTDSITPGSKVLVHDDLLATGGTAIAAAELVNKLGSKVVGFSFLVELNFLKGSQMLKDYSNNVKSLIHY